MPPRDDHLLSTWPWYCYGLLTAFLRTLIPAVQHVFALSPVVLNMSFYRVLQNIIKLKPRTKYILAVDDSKNTLEEVVKVKVFLVH